MNMNLYEYGNSWQQKCDDVAPDKCIESLNLHNLAAETSLPPSHPHPHPRHSSCFSSLLFSLIAHPLSLSLCSKNSFFFIYSDSLLHSQTKLQPRNVCLSYPTYIYTSNSTPLFSFLYISSFFFPYFAVFFLPFSGFFISQ